jgi:hypothetical protein
MEKVVSLFYNPTIKKVKKPMSKTAIRKAFRDTKKLFKELGMYDKEAKQTFTKINSLLEK